MALAVSFIVCSIFLLMGLLSATPGGLQQRPLISLDVGHGESREIDLIYELKKAEIIPTVLDTFHPQVSISVNWDNASAEYGNTIDVDATQSQPKIKFVDLNPSSNKLSKIPQLTLAITDPDAPSRDNPEWSEVCHWLVTNIPLLSSSTNFSTSSNDVNAGELEDIMPYKPPGPPEKTGKHRYVFVAMMPLNRTTEKLHLRKPDERRRWGFGHERQGLRMWAKEMGLGVIGANFIYEQNAEQ